MHPAPGRQKGRRCSDILCADASLMQSWTRLPPLTLQFGIGRSIDLSQFARSPIYGFIALTGHSIREAEAATCLDARQRALERDCAQRLNPELARGRQIRFPPSIASWFAWLRASMLRR